MSRIGEFLRSFGRPATPPIRNYVCLICGRKEQRLEVDSRTRPYCRCGNRMTKEVA